MLGGYEVVLLPFTTTYEETSFSYRQNQKTKRESKAFAFGVANAEYLQADMAQGHGEYLTSFATLLDIPEEDHAQAFMTAQRISPRIWHQGMAPQESVREFIDQLAQEGLIG